VKVVKLTEPHPVIEFYNPPPMPRLPEKIKFVMDPDLLEASTEVMIEEYADKEYSATASSLDKNIGSASKTLLNPVKSIDTLKNIQQPFPYSVFNSKILPIKKKVL
jgi:hypothetical protein